MTHLVRTATAATLLLALCSTTALAQRGAPGAGLGQDRVVVDQRTAAAIEGALRYMAARQNANGSWTAGSGEPQEVAMTGFVLIALMSAGHLPDEGEYGRHVTRGMQFLLNSVKPDGTMGSAGHYMYGHGIASIALAEIYGQTGDPRIRPRLEQVIQLIINAQNNQGGWRYQPRVGDADISVTVLQVVALRAAKNAGLDVPQATIDRAIEYVRSCHHAGSGGFTYQPRNNAPGFARTSAAMYSLQVCGKYEDERIPRAIEYMFANREDRQWFTYGHFYAAPAMYMVGGSQWERWYRHVNELLLREMRQTGDQVHWSSRDGRGGDIYATAVYTTILAMPYHYLPLYQR